MTMMYNWVIMLTWGRILMMMATEAPLVVSPVCRGDAPLTLLLCRHFHILLFEDGHRALMVDVLQIWCLSLRRPVLSLLLEFVNWSFDGFNLSQTGFRFANSVKIFFRNTRFRWWDISGMIRGRTTWMMPQYWLWLRLWLNILMGLVHRLWLLLLLLVPFRKFLAISACIQAFGGIPF